MSGSGPSSGLCDVAKGPLHGALSRAAWILGLCSAQLHPEPARLLLQVCGGEQGAQEPTGGLGQQLFSCQLCPSFSKGLGKPSALRPKPGALGALQGRQEVLGFWLHPS